MKKKKNEISKPMVKKLAKMKSRSANRLRDFLVSLDLEVEEGDEEEEDVGRRELAQPPRRVEKAIFVNRNELFLGLN